VKPGSLYLSLLCHIDTFIHHELQKDIAGLFPAFILDISVEVFGIAEITVAQCLAVRAAKFSQEIPIKLAYSMDGLVSIVFMLLWNTLPPLTTSKSNGAATANQKTACGCSGQNSPHISSGSPRIPFQGQTPHGLQTLQDGLSSGIEMHPLICLGQNLLKKLLISHHDSFRV
jgi:hypothetical protein